MAKWDFKIVGASFVKELAPVGDDVNPRSQSFMQPSFDLEGDKIVMKESGQYKTAIGFTQIGEIDGVAPTDLEDAYAKLLTLVENFNGGGGAPGTTPTLQQVTDEGATTTNQITVQNVKIGSNAFSNTIVGDIPTLPTGTGTTAIGRAAGSAATGFGGTYIGAQAGSANAFNKNICLSANSNASTASSDNQLVINTNTKNIRFDTNVPLNILFQFPTVGGRFPISVNGNTADSAGNIVVPSPYVELIFTAVQTAPQTGITSGTLIEGGRYTIADTDITADFVISGAADNEIGTVFIANATPPDWGVFGTLDFEGNPIVTILNNPLSDTYTSSYDTEGKYILEGLLDFPSNTFPKLGTHETVDLNLRCLYDFSGISNGSYLWYLNPLNPKQIIFKTANVDLQVDDVLDGSQLFIVKIFNP